MNNITAYATYLTTVVGGVKTLSRQTGHSSIRLLADYLWAALRHGTLIRQYTIGEFWRKSQMERSRCLTYPRMCHLMQRYNQAAYIHLLNEKPEFNTHFRQFVHRDWLHLSTATEEEFIQMAQRHETLIVKPVGGVEGEGVRKLALPQGDESALAALYQKLRQEDVLVEECIVQHPHMVFGNASVNTIRTMTLLGTDGRGHVVKAILRVGVGDSVVDNYCQGGSIYEVDVKTGIVCSYGKSKVGSLHITHPGTNIVMLGYQIPNWQHVIEVSERAAEQLPQVRIIGWDVAITTHGAQLIEGNHNPDYELYEFIGSTGYYEIFKQIL